MHKDTHSETALLSCLLQFGSEAYHDISTIGISKETFYDNTNQAVYKCLESLFEDDHVKEPDIPLLVNKAKNIGYEKWIEDQNIQDYLQELKTVNVSLNNSLKYAQKLRKLEVTNKIGDAMSQAQDRLQEITGEEKFSDIFTIVESRLSDIAGFLTHSSEDPKNISKELRQFLRDKAENPVDQMGLPTGFDLFDKSIGGGLRRHAITVIAARSKVGKSTFCKAIGYNIAKKGIPVLILDTEMETEDQMTRLIASASETEIEEIETGRFVKDKAAVSRIKTALDEIETTNLQHKNIAGLSVDAQLAIARKWIIKEVGLAKDGKAKECVLIYDYLKMMDSKELNQIQEYQAIGFLMTKLQNFAVQYDIPILTAAQLNRDGIDKESTAAIGASDRIAMYCSSISILKWKSREETDLENNKWGNQKLIPIIARYGPPMDGDYININFDHSRNKMTEVGTKQDSQGGYKKAAKNEKNTEKEFEIAF